MRGRAAGVVAGLVAVASACGARTPLLESEWCQGATLPVETQLPSLYFVLDHSLSMKDGNKWDQIRNVVAGVMASVGDRARFGVTILPGSAGVCSVGAEAMPLVRGDAFGAAGPTVAKFLQVTAAPPEGGTPTAATLDDLAKRLAGVRHAVAILATDGGPNCNPAISCEVGTCILNVEGLNGCVPDTPPSCCDAAVLNCLDAERAENAVSLLRAAGVPIYVVGIPGSEVYGPVLDAMAVRGGTARPGSPRYYRVESQQALATALDEIADQVTKACVLTLTTTPALAAGVTVSVRGAARARGTEWTLDDTRLTLLGTACTDFGGDKTAVHVEDGCIKAPR